MSFIVNITHKFKILTFAPIYILICGSISYLYFICSKVFIFNSKLYDKFFKIWIFGTLFLFKLLFISKIKVHYNPKILMLKKTIFISNHINHLDWFIIWISLFSMKKNKIIFNAKKSLFFYANILKYLNNKKMDFIFLERQLNYDYITLVDACNKMKKMTEYITVLFPEGTLFYRHKTRDINIKRSKVRNIETPNNLTTPKTKGFEILMENLKSELDGLINCTLVYNETISLKSFLKGKKTTIDVYIDIIDMIEVPENNSSKWLIDLFVEKDRLIGNKFLQKPDYLTIDIKVPEKYAYMFKLAFPWIISKCYKKLKFNKTKTVKSS